MIDVLAGFSLAGAAVHLENPGQLLSDVETLYHIYSTAKAGKLDVHSLDMRATVQAAARVLNVANSLVNDPAQLKNITELLASI